jgi:hypothetical protein
MIKATVTREGSSKSYEASIGAIKIWSKNKEEAIKRSEAEAMLVCKYADERSCRVIVSNEEIIVLNLNYTSNGWTIDTMIYEDGQTRHGGSLMFAADTLEEAREVFEKRVKHYEKLALET